MNRALSIKKRKSTEEGQSRESRIQCPKLIPFADEKCMHCRKPELVDEKHKENNLPLHVAERKKPKREYVDKFTVTLRQMASKGIVANLEHSKCGRFFIFCLNQNVL